MRKEVVEFKSVPEMFKREKWGSKPNTVRKLPMGGKREEKLRIWASLRDFGQIVITNSKSKESFIRDVTDVSIWQGLVIISWEHPNTKNSKKEKKQ